MACGSFSDATAARNSASEEQDGRAVVHPWRNKQTLARDLCDASTLTPVTPPYSHIHLELPTIWTGLSVSHCRCVGGVSSQAAEDKRPVGFFAVFAFFFACLCIEAITGPALLLCTGASWTPWPTFPCDAPT